MKALRSTLGTADEGIGFGAFDRFHVQVYVEVRPVKMMGLWPFDLGQLRNRGISEPWELLEGEEELSLVK